MALNITEVRVRKVNGGGKLMAFASITIDHLFVVHDLKVIDGHKGLFVAMPSRKTNSGEFKDIAHPIATEARDLIQNKVISAYLELEEPKDLVDSPDEGTLLRDDLVVDVISPVKSPTSHIGSGTAIGDVAHDI